MKTSSQTCTQARTHARTQPPKPNQTKRNTMGVFRRTQPFVWTWIENDRINYQTGKQKTKELAKRRVKSEGVYYCFE